MTTFQIIKLGSFLLIVWGLFSFLFYNAVVSELVGAIEEELSVKIGYIGKLFVLVAIEGIFLGTALLLGWLMELLLKTIFNFILL